MNEKDVGHQENHETTFTFNLTVLFKIVFSLPILAFVSCILLSMVFNFEASTATHCKVFNLLPSVSSAIGGFKLQKFIWQFLIALQCTPRLFLALMYHKYYLTFSSVRSGIHLHVLTLTDIVENLSLLFLTIVSSTEAYDYHFLGFISFVVCSQLHMMLKLLMIFSIRNDPEFSLMLEKSYSLKKKLWLINLTFIFLACYFFYRHNAVCKPWVYTWFALCEYTIVLSNIAFHGMGFYEFANTGITIDVCTFQKSKTKPA